MPRSAPRPCTHPGCGVLTNSGRCADHPRISTRSTHAKEYNKLYKTARWKRERRAHLNKHPLCVYCDQKGITKLAVILDHITPHKGDITLFWDRKNRQGLCKQCHDRKTATHDGGFGNAL